MAGRLLRRLCTWCPWVISCGETGIHLFFNILTLGDRIPSVIYSRDMRLVFILVTVYTSLVGHFRQAANQETDEDINGGMNFKVNSEFLNHSIFGGVSDRILWNCRDDSRTNYYYKSLYGGLFFSYFLTIGIYFVARVCISYWVCC